MIDIEKIKQAALAVGSSEFTQYAMNEFQALATTSAVLELIERLEAAEKAAAK